MQTSLSFWATAALGVAFAVSSFVLTTAHAEQKVGVAAAVKPEATSQPPGGGASTL
jgi:hypothetical protein